MRSVVLACVVLLSGCAGGPARDGGADDGGFVAIADLPEIDRPRERTLFALRGDGTALRLSYYADGGWTPRLWPGLAHPRAELERVFREPSSVGDRGGQIFRIEHGRVPANASAAMRPFLDGDWPAAQLLDEPAPAIYRPAFFERVSPHATTEGPHVYPTYEGEHEALGRLVAAFVEMDAAFTADSTADTTLKEGDPTCLGLRFRSEPASVPIGETVEVRAEVENCATTSVTLDPRACGSYPMLTLEVNSWVMGIGEAVLPSSTEPGAAYLRDFVCRGEAAPFTIEPGANTTMVRRWNGTFASCWSATECEFRRAVPDDYGFHAFGAFIDFRQFAQTRLVDPGGEKVHLLLVREWSWANATDAGDIEIGPHCGSVSYKTDPPSVQVSHSETRPDLGDGMVVREARVGEGTGDVSVGVDLLTFAEGRARLESHFDRDLTLAEVVAEDGAFVVNGARVEPGGSHEVRSQAEIAQEGRAYEATSILVFENVGEASLLWSISGGCA